MLHLLDILLFSIHIIIISVNLFGWIYIRTRKLHLIIVGLTLFSWLVLGLWKGFGYCILTDWHWDIKRKLGEKDLPHSFVSYLSNNVLGMSLSTSTVDYITVICFSVAIVMSIRLSFFKTNNN